MKKYSTIGQSKLSSLKELQHNYLQLGIFTGGALFSLVSSFPFAQKLMHQAMSGAMRLAANIFRSAIGQAWKSAPAAAEAAGTKIGVGGILMAVFMFIDAYKLGSFTAPYIWGDMSDYISKSKTLFRLLEDNIDRDGAKTDPKIKALNDEMTGYQAALNMGSYGLSEAAGKHYGGGMGTLQQTPPPLTDAAKTEQYIKLVLATTKDLETVINAAKNIASEDFKKRFYDVHYVQGSWINFVSQDLNQMQTIAGSLAKELEAVAQKSADYMASAFAFGDKLINANLDTDDIEHIFEPEKTISKKEYEILSCFIKVAKAIRD